MPALIEKSDSSSREPSRKKRRLSADEEVAGSCSYPLPSFPIQKPSLPNFTAGKRRRHLEDVDVSEHRQPISKQELIYDWLNESGWSRPRETWNEMPPLPSPGVSGTVCTRKSTASVHDTDYRKTLKQYHIYIRDEKPPPKLAEQAMNIISRRRDTPELDDAAIDQLRKTMRGLENAGKEMVKISLGAVIIPGFNTCPNEKVESVPNELWTETVPVPLDQYAVALAQPLSLPMPLPLPKPQPDIAFGYSEAAFNEFQLLTLPLLKNGPGGSSFASPSQDLRFPFLVVELKSKAEEGESLHVAQHQAAGAGAISMNGILELLSRDARLDDLDLNKPLFFSVIMDQMVASLNVHWIGKAPNTKQHTFHLEELTMLPLRYDDSIQVL